MQNQECWYKFCKDSRNVTTQSWSESGLRCIPDAPRADDFLRVGTYGTHAPRFYRPLLPTLNISLAWIYNDDANNERGPARYSGIYTIGYSSRIRWALWAHGALDGARGDEWSSFRCTARATALDRRRRSVKVPGPFHDRDRSHGIVPGNITSGVTL